jgi:hypothetical protein
MATMNHQKIFTLTSFAFAALFSLSNCELAPNSNPDFLLMLGDDVGMYDVEMYRISVNPPRTQSLDFNIDEVMKSLKSTTNHHKCRL